MKLTYIFIILVFVGCGTIKQPTQKETEKLLLQVLDDLVGAEYARDIDPFRLVEVEFAKAITGPYSSFTDDFVFENSEKFFSNFNRCELDVEEEFKIPQHKAYYQKQSKIDNSVLIKVKDGRKRGEDESRLQNSLQISRPFFSLKKDIAIILVASNFYGGGRIKVYKLIDEEWEEVCYFYPFYY